MVLPSLLGEFFSLLELSNPASPSGVPTSEYVLSAAVRLDPGVLEPGPAPEVALLGRGDVSPFPSPQGSGGEQTPPYKGKSTALGSPGSKIFGGKYLMGRMKFFQALPWHGEVGQGFGSGNDRPCLCPASTGCGVATERCVRATGGLGWWREQSCASRKATTLSRRPCSYLASSRCTKGKTKDKEDWGWVGEWLSAGRPRGFETSLSQEHHTELRPRKDHWEQFWFDFGLCREFHVTAKEQKQAFVSVQSLFF